MRKPMFELKIKFDGVPLVHNKFKNVNEMEEELRLIRRKMN